MVASVGYKGSFAGDASKPFLFCWKEWTRVLSRKEKKNKIKEEAVVNFEVAPEEKNLTTYRRQVTTAGKISQRNKKKEPKKGKQYREDAGGTTY